MNPGRELERYSGQILLKFEEFCQVDLNLTKATTVLHRRNISKFMQQIEKPVELVAVDDIRAYLKLFIGSSSATYANELKSLKVFFRDFLGREDAVASFKFPRRSFIPRTVPTRQQLAKAYYSLNSSKQRALFLLYASSGLRKSELRRMMTSWVNLRERMMVPNHLTRTKNSWCSFYNEEAEADLQDYLGSRKDDSPRLIALSTKEYTSIWRSAGKAAGTKITPQLLREWFCSEMGQLGVPDRYVDAFCGRTPNSVLARHYTDYSPEVLKRVYDNAGLHVLS